jgi:hypothetical protein
MARADTAEREARSAREQGTQCDYLSPAARTPTTRLSAEGWQPTGDGESPRGLPGAARVAALHGKKVFACRIPWTRPGSTSP